MAQSDYPRRNSLVFPILLVVIGALFLYADYSPAFDPWPILTTYWPLLLIFIGIGKLWDVSRQRQNPDAPPRFSVGGAIGVLAFILVLVALLWHGRAFSSEWHSSRDVRHESRTVDLQSAHSVRTSLQVGAGELTIRGGSSRLLDGDFSFGGSYSTPRVDYNVENGVGQLTISQHDGSVHFGHSDNEWDLHFGNNIPLELKIEMGAGRGNLHFNDMQVTRLELEMGAGQVDVDLTGDRKVDLVADIQGGVGQATIRLPKNVGVTARASGGIGTVSARGLKHNGDEYTNDAFGKTPATIRLKIEGGIGQIILIQES